MIPTSIDGTDITGATIDGTDVTEITVDGDVVFSAQNLPVAYSNLIAWFPFDSSFYGGTELTDATSVFDPGSSGDSTAYNLSELNGSASYQSSGGRTDINDGASSGSYDLPSSGLIRGSDSGPSPFGGFFSSGSWTVMLWLKTTKSNSGDRGGIVDMRSFGNTRTSGFQLTVGIDSGVVDSGLLTNQGDWNSEIQGSTNVADGIFHHVAFAYDDSADQMDLIVDGAVEDNTTGFSGNDCTYCGIGFRMRDSFSAKSFGDLEVDDFRIYNTDVSGSISQIITNTSP